MDRWLPRHLGDLGADVELHRILGVRHGQQALDDHGALAHTSAFRSLAAALRASAAAARLARSLSQHHNALLTLSRSSSLSQYNIQQVWYFIMMFILFIDFMTDAGKYIVTVVTASLSPVQRDSQGYS